MPALKVQFGELRLGRRRALARIASFALLCSLLKPHRRLDPIAVHAVVAQIKIESNVCKQFMILWFQELKPAVNLHCPTTPSSLR
jgi:hypothetical protein